MRIAFNKFTWKDTNAQTLAITGDERVAIQRKSKIEFTFAAESSAGPIDYYDLYISEDEPKISIPATRSTYTREVYDNKRTFVRCVAVDCDGNTTEAGGWLDILPYTAPAVDGSAVRLNNFEAATTLTAAATVAELGGNNTKRVTYKYKEAGATAYSTPAELAEGEAVVVTLDNLKAWEVVFTVADAFETTSEAVTVAKGRPAAMVDSVKKSFSVDGLPVHDSAIEAPHMYAGGVELIPKPARYKSATVTAAATNTAGTICTLQLPAGTFAVFGSVQSSIGGGSTLQSCILEAGTNAALLAGQQGRTTMNGGGGVTAWALFRLSAPGSVLLRSYNCYSNNSYNWYGHVFALQLDE